MRGHGRAAIALAPFLLFLAAFLFWPATSRRKARRTGSLRSRIESFNCRPAPPVDRSVSSPLTNSLVFWVSG